jgi:hypothetical protein
MIDRVFPPARQLLSALRSTLWRSRAWAAMQFACLPLLVAAGLGWTRIPEKHAWQVALSLLIPILLAAGFLMLQAGTVRCLLRHPRLEPEAGLPPVSLAWGAATLLAWLAIGWLAWSLLDRFGDHIELWSGYLNSRFRAGARASIATEAHIAWLLTYLERALRWVVVPGLLLPLSSSAAWGVRRLPWKRAQLMWLNWRWWPAVLAAALVGVAWPQWFFSAPPHGSVSAQVWRVAIKLIAGFLLAVSSWLALLGWTATLLCAGPVVEERDDDESDLAGVGVRVRPPDGSKSGSVRLPLPESGDDPAGNA